MTGIRTIVLGLAIDDGRVLVSEGHDGVKGERFYRPPGGEIEFGESSEAALRREWREELDDELAGVRFLGVLENRFVFNGEAGHEIALVYAVESGDLDRLRAESVVLSEGPLTYPAAWLPLADARDGSARLYPDGLIGLIDASDGTAPNVR